MTTATKTCTVCGCDLPMDAYSVNSRARDGRLSRCRGCDSARSRAYYYAHPERMAALNERSKVKYQRVRAAAVAVYGGSCVRCGSTSDDLQFDHVHGCGEAHRAGESHHQYLRRIAREGRLPDVELQLLCGPCHRAKTLGESARDGAGRWAREGDRA